MEQKAGLFSSNIAAIVLAAGQGRRMESKIQKQYMELKGKPLLYHTLSAFERSCVDQVIVVVGQGEIPFCRETIVDAFGFQKVVQIVEGGRERYHSVYEGLKALRELGGCSCVLIHDGARPLVTEKIIENAATGAEAYKACVVGMPVKDTIKTVDPYGFAADTPDRSRLWAVQTPQAFQWELIWNAYGKLMEQESFQQGITDDAMVVETMTSEKVKLIPGSYANIKVTTPEDMAIAAVLLEEQKGNR
ncbi:MAG: 2-C-methyl-D-erythritol 4-phosphate cytidylyltransferase [Lachnospiraceae bacterium]